MIYPEFSKQQDTIPKLETANFVYNIPFGFDNVQIVDWSANYRKRMI